MNTDEARRRIEDLNADYAHCIDDDRLEELPDFFTKDCLYKVISRDNFARGMLIDRITALRQANVYEPHVYRHLISAVRVTGEADGVWSAEAGYGVIRTMQEGEISVFNSGKYLDRIVEEDGRLKFKERIAVFDSRRIDTLLVIPI